MFQTVFPSIFRSTKLRIQRQAFVRPLPLPAAGLNGMEHPIQASKCLTLCVQFCAPDDGRKKPSETCTASYRNKYIEKLCILLVVLCEYTGSASESDDF